MSIKQGFSLLERSGAGISLEKHAGLRDIYSLSTLHDLVIFKFLDDKMCCDMSWKMLAKSIFCSRWNPCDLYNEGQ